VNEHDLAYRLGTAWAQLNAWETPPELRKKLGRDLTHEELRAAWPIISWLIPDDIAQAGWKARLNRKRA